MTATEQLRAEHEGIRLMLRILEKYCAKLEGGEAVDPEDGERMVEFIRVFADRCHHEKEEGLLFPSMERHGIPREGGPIGVMLHEHEAGRAFVRGMVEALEKFRGGDKGAGSAFVENARGYIQLLSAHIEKENQVLFPMADMRLTAGEQTELAEAFETVETEKIGAGKHEEFHALLDRLREIYLG